MTDWLDVATERSDWRSENGKCYVLDPSSGFGQFGLEARTGPIHYQENQTGPWLDIDTEYSEDMGDYLWYPKMHRKIKVYKNILAYESVGPTGHTLRMELISVDGTPLSAIPGAMRFVTSIDKHPFKVGIKAKSSYTLNKNYTVRWRVTEIGSPEGDRYPYAFKAQREAYSIDDLTGLFGSALDAVRLNVQSTRTDIDATSWYLDEIWPKGAKLMNPNTDFQVGAGTDDGRASADYPPSGYYDNNVTYATIGYFSAVPSTWNVFWRVAVAIPQSAVIVTATLTYKAQSSGDAGSTVNTRIYTEDAANPGAITSLSDYLARTRSSGYVDWNFTAINTAGTGMTSPSVVALLQTRTDSALWVSGNYIQWLHQNNASAKVQHWYTYDNASTDAPKLTATWTVGHPAIRRFGGIPFCRQLSVQGRNVW